MADWYVHSGAGGSGSGADWTNAKTTIAAAITAGAAGDTYYLADDHSESSGSNIALAPKGTSSAVDRYLCVRRVGGSVPPVSADLRTTAQITTTSTAVVLVGNGGVAYFYGIKFTSAGNLSISTGSSEPGYTFEACYFKASNGGSIGSFNLSNPNSSVFEFKNCQFEFGRTAASILILGNCCAVWRGGSVVGATLPTTLFNGSTKTQGRFILDGMDLSILGSGKTLVGNGANFGYLALVNCKLGSSVTVASTPSGPANGSVIDLLNCDSGGTGYRQERYSYQGTLTGETTVVRTGGASDGTQAISHRIVTTANANALFPFEGFETAVWVDTVGASKTLTIETVTDSVTLKSNECWIEAQVLDASGAPLASLYTSGVDVLAAGSNNASSSATWTTTGLTTPVKQKMSVTFTDQIKGYVRLMVKVAKPSATVYVCPKPDVS